MMEKVAVLVITCKKFEQAWDPFFTLFKKYWDDCPYKVFMITDFGKYDDEMVTNITLENDYGFATNLSHGLQALDADYIIYFQEDYFFTDYFDTERIISHVKHAKDYEVACIRLAPCPGPTKEWPYNDYLGILEKEAKYRVSTQTAIWNKEVLLSLLVPGETGGQFEVRGTRRSCGIEKPFLSVWRGESPSPYYITGIVRGVWQDGAIKLLEKHGIPTGHIKRVVK